MTISFSARTDFCAGAVNRARVTISPSTEIDSHESSRALITTSRFPWAGTAGGGTGEDEAITCWDDVDPPAGTVVASTGFAEESTGSFGFCAGGEVSPVAAGALGALAAGEAETEALFCDSREYKPHPAKPMAASSSTMANMPQGRSERFLLFFSGDFEHRRLVVFLGVVCWRAGSSRGHVLSNGLLFIHVQTARVSANEAFVKNAARQLIEMFFFQRAQHPGTNFRGQGYLLESQPLLLPLLFQLRAKRCHDRLLLHKNIIGQSVAINICYRSARKSKIVQV